MAGTFIELIIKNTFHKKERLCSRKSIDALFEKGTSYNVYPVKVMYIEITYNTDHPVKAMFVVPKRNFKKAHDRNKLRRRMKESYRLNKSVFYQSIGLRKLQVAFIYTSRKAEEYSMINAAVTTILKKMGSGS
jgi:ribonuclease P protein component